MGITEDDYFQMKTKLRHSLTINDWWGFTIMAKNLLILYPGRRAELIPDQKEFDITKTELDLYRTHGRWWQYGVLGERLAIIYPKRKPELMFGEKEALGLKELIREHQRNLDLLGICHVAKFLCVLSAESIEIDSNGQLRLINKIKPLVGPRKPLPIRSRSSKRK